MIKKERTGQKKHDTYKYQFKVGNKVVYGGITKDLERREREHQQTYSQKGHIKQIGRKTTEEVARRWEQEKGYILPKAHVNVPMSSKRSAGRDRK